MKPQRFLVILVFLLVLLSFNSLAAIKDCTTYRNEYIFCDDAESFSHPEDNGWTLLTNKVGIYNNTLFANGTKSITVNDTSMVFYKIFATDTNYSNITMDFWYYLSEGVKSNFFGLLTTGRVIGFQIGAKQTLSAADYCYNLDYSLDNCNEDTLLARWLNHWVHVRFVNIYNSSGKFGQIYLNDTLLDVDNAMAQYKITRIEWESEAADVGTDGIDDLYICNNNGISDAVCPLTTGVTDVYFDLTAKDLYDASVINDFNATIYNGTYQDTRATTNGTIKFSVESGNFSINVSSTNYFLQQYKSINSANDTIAKLYQSELILNASELGTNVIINSFNVSSPSQTNATVNGTARLFLKAGTYNIVGTSTGYINLIKSVTLSALETQKTEMKFGTSNLTIYAKKYFSNTTINSYSVTITNQNYSYSESASTTTGKISFGLINGNYNLTISSTGYSSTSENITINSLSQNTTFYLFDINSVYIRLLNEEDNSLLSGFTFSIDVTDSTSSFQNTYSTSNGTLYLTNLPSETYRIEPYNTEYTKRTYYVSLENNAHSNLDIRMLNNTYGTLITFILKSNSNSNPIQDLSIIATKQVNLSYLTVDQDITDYSGSSQLFLKYGRRYRFILSHTDYGIREIEITPSQSSYTIYLKPEGDVTFETILDLFKAKIMPTDEIINPVYTIFNITTSCVGNTTGCFEFYGLKYNLTIYTNITANPSGSTATIALNLTNISGNILIQYWVKVNNNDIYMFNKTYVILPAIVMGNQSLPKLIEKAEGIFPSWFRPVAAVSSAVIVMVLFYQVGIPATGLAVIGGLVEIVFAIFGWIPRTLIFFIVIVIFLGWISRDSGGEQ